MALLGLSESLTVGMPFALVSLQTSEMGSKVSSPLLTARMAAAEIVGEQRAPTVREADAAVEIFVQANDFVDVKAVARDEALAARVLVVAHQPIDVLVAGDKWIFRIGAFAGPGCDPVGRAIEELRGAEGVRQHDEQLVVITLRP